LKQLSLALHNYESTFGTLPPSGIDSNEMSWVVLLLPYIEQQPLFDKFNFNKGGWNSFSRIDIVRNIRIKAILCPDLTTAADSFSQFGDEQNVSALHYYAVLGPNGPNGIGGGNQPYLVQGADQGFGLCAVQGAFGQCRLNGTNVVPLSNPLRTFTDGTSNTLLLGEMAW